MKNTPKMIEKMAASNKRMAPYCEVVDTWPRMKMDEAKQAGFQPFTTGFCVDERPIRVVRPRRKRGRRGEG